MKKLIFITIAILTMSLGFTGCSGDEKTDQELKTQVKTEKAQEEGAVKNVEKESKNFASIINIMELIEDAIEYSDKGAEDLDNMDLMGDQMTLAMLGMPIANANLDYAMNGMQETWKVVDEEMPNGAGTYDTIMNKESDTYIYEHRNNWNQGFGSYTNLQYNPKNNTVDYRFESGGNSAETILAQYYINEGKLYLSYCDYNQGSQTMTQMIIYYDGKNVNFARNYQVATSEAKLPIDILSKEPNSWDALMAGQIYESMFTYDGSEAKYEKK